MHISGASLARRNWLLLRHDAQEGWQGNGTSTLLQCCQEAVLS
jgi:hypothetical protein